LGYDGCPLFIIFTMQRYWKISFPLALCSKFIKKSRYRKNLCFFLFLVLKILKTVDWHTTFTERCRNQETSHLEDDPLFFILVLKTLKIVDGCTTFTERCRNQETSHLEDDPLFCYYYFFLEVVSLWWVTYPSKKERKMRARRRARKNVRAQRRSKRKARTQRRSKRSEGSKARSKRKWGLKGARREARAQRRSKREMKAQRRSKRSEGSKALEGKRGLKGALEEEARAQRRSKGSEGSKARSKRKRGLKGARREAEKTQRFFRWPISHGRPAQVKKILKNEKILTAIWIFGHFKLAFHLMDSAGIFSYEICKTYCPMSQCLDDMHASLPVLKYRPPFLLSLLVGWLMRTCYFWFGSSLSFGF